MSSETEMSKNNLWVPMWHQITDLHIERYPKHVLTYGRRWSLVSRTHNERCPYRPSDPLKDCPGHARTRPACRAWQSLYVSDVSTIHAATVTACPSAISGRSGHGAAKSAGGAGGWYATDCLVCDAQPPVIKTRASDSADNGFAYHADSFFFIL